MHELALHFKQIRGEQIYGRWSASGKTNALDERWKKIHIGAEYIHIYGGMISIEIGKMQREELAAEKNGDCI